MRSVSTVPSSAFQFLGLMVVTAGHCWYRLNMLYTEPPVDDTEWEAREREHGERVGRAMWRNKARVCFEAGQALQCWAQWETYCDPSTRDWRYRKWQRAKIKIWRLSMPANNPFSKPRPCAWILCYDLAPGEVGDPHVAEQMMQAEEITVNQLKADAASEA